jgi:hypothetical protein
MSNSGRFSVILPTHRVLVLITHGKCRNDVKNWHATLLTVVVEETALSHKMLFSIGHQDVVYAVESRENCLIAATFKLAGFLWSSETEGKGESCKIL